MIKVQWGGKRWFSVYDSVHTVITRPGASYKNIRFWTSLSRSLWDLGWLFTKYKLYFHQYFPCLLFSHLAPYTVAFLLITSRCNLRAPSFSLHLLQSSIRIFNAATAISFFRTWGSPSPCGSTTPDIYKSPSNFFSSLHISYLNSLAPYGLVIHVLVHHYPFKFCVVWSKFITPSLFRISFFAKLTLPSLSLCFLFGCRRRRKHFQQQEWH